MSTGGRIAGKGGPPRPGMSEGAHALFHSKLAVLHPVRVSDHRKRQQGLIAAQLFDSRMEHHHFGDSGIDNLLMSVGEAAQIQVANRAASKPPELQMRPSLLRRHITDRPSIASRWRTGTVAPQDNLVATARSYGEVHRYGTPFVSVVTVSVYTDPAHLAQSVGP